MRLPVRFLHHLTVPLATAGAVLAAGCAVTAHRPVPIQMTNAPGAHNATSESADIAETPAGLAPVVRQGRYRLVELAPEAAQRDLLRQVIEVAIPPTLDASVGDALRHVVLRTGHRLCNTTDAAALYALPLPAAHLRLGPVPLRDALQTLAGPAWKLSVDEASREVCFRRATTARAANPSPVPANPSVSANRTQSPQPEGRQP